MPKKTFKFGSLADDIRQCKKESEILVKYNLTTKQLESVLNRMLKVGYLKDSEVWQWLRLTESQMMKAFRENASPAED